MPAAVCFRSRWPGGGRCGPRCAKCSIFPRCSSQQESWGTGRRCTRRPWRRATKASWPNTWRRPTGRDDARPRGGRSSPNGDEMVRENGPRGVPSAHFFRNFGSRTPARDSNSLTRRLTPRGVLKEVTNEMVQSASFCDTSFLMSCGAAAWSVNRRGSEFVPWFVAPPRNGLEISPRW